MDAERPPPNDAELLLRLVRGMTAIDFSGAFRHGLSAQELMALITALPTRRLNELTDRARLLALPAEQQHAHDQRQRLAAAISDARERAEISPDELAGAGRGDAGRGGPVGSGGGPANRVAPGQPAPRAAGAEGPARGAARPAAP